ncbi:WD40-repeat-containing domain protein [Coemansia mojavensis]|nr:WD40-repeat-containing domain protein [Coemansia mojavensis]
MERRREELEKKRAKLAELRRQREERNRASMQEREQQGAVSTLQRCRGKINTQDINDLVNSLVGERARSPLSQAGAATVSSREIPVLGRDRSILSATSAGTKVSSPEPAAAATAVQVASPLGPPAARTVPEFKAQSMVIFDFAPQEKIVYSKEVQTVDIEPEQSMLAEEEVERRVQQIREKEERARAAREEERARREAEAQAREAETRRLTEEQRESILQSGDFAAFLERRALVVERALDEDYDIMADYTREAAGETTEAGTARLALAQAFHDDRVSRNRAVMDVAWSTRFPELMAAAYNRNPMAPNEPDGLVAVWNMHLHERPEFVFSAPSDVLRVTFSDFNPHVVVGGAYSGQILLWDTRARALPVLKTPLTGGHTHPVYSLKVVGSTNAHQLISASTDGLVCAWQLDMLAQPHEALELSHPAHLRTDEVSVTCMDFADNETAAFVVGTAEGVAYPVNRYDRAGCKAGLNGFDAYRAHAAPINSLAFHPPAADLADLFLTASSDWTVRLWRARPAAKPASGVPADIKPLHAFDAFDDYVYDARWSPTHPAVFATADGTGRLALWDLTHDLELPRQTVVASQHALNRLAWDRPGRRIAAGGVDGTVYVYEAGDLASPHPDDHAKLTRTLSGLAAGL